MDIFQQAIKEEQENPTKYKPTMFDFLTADSDEKAIEIWRQMKLGGYQIRNKIKG